MNVRFKLLSVVLTMCISHPVFSEDINSEVSFSVQSYSEAFGVDYDEARERIQRQDEIGELNEILLLDEYENYAGLYIQNEPVYKIIVLFKQPHVNGNGRRNKGNWKGKLQKRLAKTSWRSFVKIRKVPFSLAELRSSQDQIVDILNFLNERADSSVDVINNLIELSVLDKNAFELKLENYGLVLPSNVRLGEVSSLSELTSQVYAGENGLGCTLGFAVKNSIGTKGMLTAGHCDDDQLYDGILMPYKAQVNFGRYDVQWNTLGGGYTPVNRVKTGFFFYETITGIKSKNFQSVGMQVCKYGRNTGAGCGIISAINVLGGDENHNSPSYIRITNNSSDLAGHGDSGGPIYYNNKAFGVMHAQRKNNNTGYYDAIYMPIDNIDILGLTVLTQ